MCRTTIKNFGAMKMFIAAGWPLLSCLCFLSGCMSGDPMLRGFMNPPEDTKPGIYWYWMNEHITKDGITKDLEALAGVGIGEVYIGNIYEGWAAPGNVTSMSDEWIDCMRFAISEGTRIGIRVSTFNSGGWSLSGGPWVKPEDANRYLVCSQTTVEGPADVELAIAKPKEFFQDVVMLAYPVVDSNIAVPAELSVQPDCSRIAALTDSDPATDCVFGNGNHGRIQIDISFERPVRKRGLYIKPGEQVFATVCSVYAEKDGVYELVAEKWFDRINRTVTMGPEPYAPLVMSIGNAVSDRFRIVLSDLPPEFRISELALTSKPLLENYPEKLLNKMPSRATPDWFAYMWENQEQFDGEGIVDAGQVLNITDSFDGQTLRWSVPEGKWTVLRVGMTTTNATNNPSPPALKGLEIDKLSKRPIADHYDSYVGRIVEGMSSEDLESFSRVIADSYETGPMNWTEGFHDVFTGRYGYDPYPYMAVLTGQIVGSVDQSNRFLWDLRRLVAERIASQYVGGMKEECERNGTELWLENYGWDGFPSEFLLYSKYSPAVGGEFWTNAGENIECRLAASGCHVYGKNTVYAESYTTSGNTFGYYPGNIKKYGDKSYVDGVNQHILHLCIHQPYDDKVPGINTWFGIEYNRHNTWFEQSVSWIDYQRRCCFMLRQGRHHADVCYFISEESPKMSGWVDGDMSPGYDYDFVNSDVIRNYFKVKNGKLTLPSGIEYSLLVLPPINTMRPEVLESIRELVRQGAVVLGRPVERSPSLAGYPECDGMVGRLSKELWNTDDYSTADTIRNNLGKGRVFCNVPVNSVLEEIGVREAVGFEGGEALLWKQRKFDKGDLFFVCNQSDEAAEFEATFNVTGFTPELWDPVDGTVRKLECFSFENGLTKIPLRLEASGSCFVVFREKTRTQGTGQSNYPSLVTVYSFDDTWDIAFHNKWTGENYCLGGHPLEEWSESDDAGLRHFAGTITYVNQFDFEGKQDGDVIFLEFEHMSETASVSVNGNLLDRVLWCRPYRIDVSEYLKNGKNSLEVRVTTSWKNKMIQQDALPQEQRSIYFTYNRPWPGLSPSGIRGKTELLKIQ